MLRFPRPYLFLKGFRPRGTSSEFFSKLLEAGIQICRVPFQP
jgi:hypothetical protein